VLVLAYPAGMGWGDVKVTGLIGGVLAYLSWGALLVGAFAGFVLGAVVGVMVMAAGRGGRKSALPFGVLDIFIWAEWPVDYAAWLVNRPAPEVPSY
jgi:hypothetical protein